MLARCQGRDVPGVLGARGARGKCSAITFQYHKIGVALRVGALRQSHGDRRRTQSIAEIAQRADLEAAKAGANLRGIAGDVAQDGEAGGVIAQAQVCLCPGHMVEHQAQHTAIQRRVCIGNQHLVPIDPGTEAATAALARAAVKGGGAVDTEYQVGACQTECQGQQPGLTAGVLFHFSCSILQCHAAVQKPGAAVEHADIVEGRQGAGWRFGGDAHRRGQQKAQ